VSESYWKGIIYCVIAALAWGVSFPVMSDALRTIDPFNFTTLRYIAVALVFVLLLLRREGLAALDLRGERYLLAWLLGSAGFCGYGFFIFQGQRLAGTDGALSAAVVIASTPLLTQLLNWLLHGVRPTRVALVCITTSFFGILLVITKGQPALLLHRGVAVDALFFLLFGAVSWAVYTLGSGFFPSWSAYRYTGVTTLLSLSTICIANFVLQQLSVIALPSMMALRLVFPHLTYMVLRAK